MSRFQSAPLRERKWPRRVACAVLLGFLSCGGVSAALDEDPGDFYAYYERAAERFSVGDVPAAVADLQIALQRNPQHVPSRVLLGRAHLRSGHASMAEKEFTRALSLGADESLVLVPLGNALLLQRKHEEILELVQSRKPGSNGGAGVLAIRGRAYLELGDLTNAEQAFAEAMWLAPDRPEPLLGQAYVSILRDEFDQAESLIERAHGVAPLNTEVWFRRGQLLVVKGEREQALVEFDRALAANPSHTRARLARARLHLSLGNSQHARDDAEQILTEIPGDAHAALLSAQASARLGNAGAAADSFEAAATRMAEIDETFLWRNPAALVLAGKISFVRRNYASANRYLSRYLKLAPQASAVVLKLLARARLQVGDSSGAVTVLEPLVQKSGEDAEALALLGDAYVRERMYFQAVDAFERAARLTADDPIMRTRLAISHMGTGRTEAAVSDLEQAFRLDAGSFRAGLLLTFVHLRRQDTSAALDTALELRRRFPDRAVVENLIGLVWRNAHNLERARAAFHRAQELDAAFSPAAYNLADLELQAANYDVARSAYQLILGRDPSAARAMVGLSNVAMATGREFEGTSLLEKAVAIVPNAVEPNLRLIDHYLRMNRPDDALRAADAILQRRPEDPVVVEHVARTMLAIGRRADVRTLLRSASRFASYAADNLLRIGELQSGLGDYEGAKWTFHKVLKTKLHNAGSTALVRLEIAHGKADAAREIAEALLAKAPTEALGHLMVGEVLLLQGALGEAVASFERALALEQTADTVVSLFEARMKTGAFDVALAHLETWVVDNPADVRSLRALGLGYIATGKLEKAEAIHLELLRLQPEDPLILNNLARMYQLKKDKRARELASRAVEHAPTWPIGLDTLGWILVTEGEPEKGLRLLRDAHARAAENPLIHYHLAGALSELGRNRESLIELDAILRAQPSLSWIDDVINLRNEVKNR